MLILFRKSMQRGDIIIGLRVDEEQETEGLDITQHEERGYIL